MTRDRPGAHGEDVADDAADAGRRALVRLDVGRVVVRLDLEGDRPAVADVDDAGVLAHADEQRVGLRRLLAELAQVDLRGLVGAVLAPHHRVDRELGAGRAAAEDLAHRRYSSSVMPSSCLRLRVVRRLARRARRCRRRTVVQLGHAFAPARAWKNAQAVGADADERLDRVLGVRHEARRRCPPRCGCRRCRGSCRSGCRRGSARRPVPRPRVRRACGDRRRSRPRRS